MRLGTALIWIKVAYVHHSRAIRQPNSGNRDQPVACLRKTRAIVSRSRMQYKVSHVASIGQAAKRSRLATHFPLPHSR